MLVRYAGRIVVQCVQWGQRGVDAQGSQEAVRTLRCEFKAGVCLWYSCREGPWEENGAVGESDEQWPFEPTGPVAELEESYTEGWPGRGTGRRARSEAAAACERK